MDTSKWFLLTGMVALLTACGPRAPSSTEDAGTDAGGATLANGIALGLNGGAGLPQGMATAYQRVPTLRRVADGSVALFYLENTALASGYDSIAVRFQRIDPSGKLAHPSPGKLIGEQGKGDSPRYIQQLQVSHESEPWALVWTSTKTDRPKDLDEVTTYGALIDRDGKGWVRAFPKIDPCEGVSRVGDVAIARCGDWVQRVSSPPDLIWLTKDDAKVGPVMAQSEVEGRPLGTDKGLIELYDVWQGQVATFTRGFLPRLGTDRAATELLGARSNVLRYFPLDASGGGTARYFALFELQLDTGGPWKPSRIEARVVGFDADGAPVKLGDDETKEVWTYKEYGRPFFSWVSGSSEVHMLFGYSGDETQCKHVSRDISGEAPATVGVLKSPAVCTKSFGIYRGRNFAGHADGGFSVLRGGLWEGTKTLLDADRVGEELVVLERYNADSTLRFREVLFRCPHPSCIHPGSAYAIMADGEGGSYVLWGGRELLRKQLGDKTGAYGKQLLIQRYDKDGKALWNSDAGAP